MTVYVDRLTVSVLLMILFVLKARRVVYFTEQTAMAARVHALLQRFGVPGVPIAKSDHYFMEIRDNGGADWTRLNKDCLKQVDAAYAETFGRDPLVERCAKRFGRREHVRRFFYRELYQSIIHSLKQIALVAWSARKDGVEGDCVYLHERNRYSRILGRTAAGQGVPFQSYFEIETWKEWPGINLVLLVRQLCMVGFHSLVARLRQPDHASGTSSPASIVQHYGGSKIVLKGGDKDELQWLEPDSPLAGRLVLAEFNGDAVEDGAVAALKRKGVRFFGSNPEAEQWKPTGRRQEMTASLVQSVCRDAAKGLINGSLPDPLVMKHLFTVADSYAYWYDFYAACNARVVTAGWLHDMGKVLAAEKAGAAIVLFQDSISNYGLYHPLHLTGHLDLLYSRYFVDSYDAARRASTYLLAGYNHPLQRAMDRSSADVAALREKLADNGARFVAAFFDENFMDRWFFHDPIETIDIYAELFRRVIDDPTFGLICKPKAPNAIGQRLGTIGELMRKAEATGRCHVYQSTSVCRTLYPGVVAGAADVCIGQELGGTASMESFLLGKPSVMIDSCGRQPKHGGVSLNGTVCFESAQAMFEAFDRFRENPEACPGFGDWTPWIHTLLAHVDGDGPARRAAVYGWLMENAESGMALDERVADAAAKFTEAWGGTSVVEHDARAVKPWEAEADG